MSLPALTGIRFFAIFHIFLFHLWVLSDIDKPERFAQLLSGVGDLPQRFQNFIANGWMSTSFFFILSGFILSYVYWGKNGELTLPAKRFWLLRLTRLYPIHFITIVVTIGLVIGMYLGNNPNYLKLSLSALATLTLTQAWYPPWVPVWSWPTWTISALVFLYVLLPWLMRVLACLSRTQQIATLIALPFVSVIPTAIYSLYFPAGVERVQNWQIFVGSFPPFWVPQFIAGMLLCRVGEFSRDKSAGHQEAKRTGVAWGDGALILVIVMACVPDIEEPLKFYLRHGLMMPLYLLIIFDFAKGRGIFARILSNRLFLFLGETGYSVFIWQNLVMIFCWMAVSLNPEIGKWQFYIAAACMVLLAVVSTYAIERPLSRKLRRKFLSPRLKDGG